MTLLHCGRCACKASSGSRVPLTGQIPMYLLHVCDGACCSRCTVIVQRYNGGCPCLQRPVWCAGWNFAWISAAMHAVPLVLLLAFCTSGAVQSNCCLLAYATDPQAVRGCAETWLARTPFGFPLVVSCGRKYADAAQCYAPMVVRLYVGGDAQMSQASGGLSCLPRWIASTRHACVSIHRYTGWSTACGYHGCCRVLQRWRPSLLSV
jgi:hypothetical protein